jgi:hypothetical protein
LSSTFAVYVPLQKGQFLAHFSFLRKEGEKVSLWELWFLCIPLTTFEPRNLMWVCYGVGDHLNAVLNFLQPIKLIHTL